MKHVTRRPPFTPVAHRRRASRSLDLLATVPDDRSAAAMDDAAEAERLLDDLMALVDAGLLAPVEDGAEIRYAIAEPEDLTA
jgi:hypothetical protein